MIQDQIKLLALTPDPIIPENLPSPLIYLMHHVAGWIAMKLGVEPWPIPENVEVRILESYEVLPWEIFIKRIVEFCEALSWLDIGKEKLWDALASHLRPGKYIDRFKNPSPDSPKASIGNKFEQEMERKFPGVLARARSMTKEEHNRAQAREEKETLTRYEELKKRGVLWEKDLKKGGSNPSARKYYERIFKMTAHEFISKELRDPLAADIHTFMIKHADPHFQAWDNAYYDSSHAKIERKVKRSIRTIEDKVSFLKRKHWICLVAPSRLDPPRCAKYQLARTPREMKFFELNMVDYKKRRKDETLPL